jgi:hypothetical protein
MSPAARPSTRTKVMTSGQRFAINCAIGVMFATTWASLDNLVDHRRQIDHDLARKADIDLQHPRAK